MRYIKFILLFATLNSVAQVDSTPYFANHTDDVTCISFSPDGKYIVTGSWDQSIIVQRNDSAAEVVQQVSDFQGAITSMAFSRDGYKLIAGGQDGQLIFYTFDDSYFDILTQDTILTINESQINKLIYGPGMRTVFSGGNDGRFLTYDIAKDKVIPMKRDRPICAAAVAIDRMSYFIATEGDAVIRQFNVFGKELRAFEGHANDVTDIVVTVDRKYMISSSKDRTIRIWNIAKSKEEAKFEDHTWAVSDIDIDAFGLFLVSGGLDGKVNLYDLKTRTRLKQKEYKGYRINAVSLSPDNTQFVAAGQPKGVSSPAGFFVDSTGLKLRKVVLPKRAVIKKIPKKKPKPTSARKPSTTKGKSTPTRKTGTSSLKSNESIIKKTDQVEIRREN